MYQFECISSDSQNVIKLPQVVQIEHCEAFAAQTEAWMLLPAQTHVLDFTGVLAFDRRVYPTVAAFAKLLRANKKGFFTINMSPTLLAQIKADGMINLLTPKAPPKLDVRFVNPFVAAVIEVLGTQTSTTVVGQKPYLKTENTVLDVGILGIVAINTNLFRGNIALCFPTPVFLNVYERMLGEKHTEISQEIEDAVGELLNMVYGKAKTELNRDLGYDFQPALPTVLRGEKLSLRQQVRNPVIVLPFSSEIGTFHLEIATDASANPQQRSA